LEKARESIANGTKWTKDLIAEGERLRSSGSPRPDDISAFVNAVEKWRLVVTWWFNYYANNGPDEGRSGCDTILHDPKLGGKLEEIRRTFGS
jgi:hypothetical protein